MKLINAIRMGGHETLPLVEGGKGVAISNGITSGHWAAAGGAGTFSAVNADSYDSDGRAIPQEYHGRTRRDRHEELIAYAIEGGVTQAQRAYDISGGKGRIHANILWEMGGAERVITGILERTKGIVNGRRTSRPSSMCIITPSSPPAALSARFGSGLIPRSRI
jgi:hypothetical protein